MYAALYWLVSLLSLSSQSMAWGVLRSTQRGSSSAPSTFALGKGKIVSNGASQEL